MPNQKKDTPMQITVRLYRQHDMDLVGLYRTKDFKFQRHMKNALKAYAEGKDYRINHPGDEDIRKGYVPKIVQMHIYLTVEQDADAISALKTIREGYRGAFLKALFRKYLNNEPLEAYKDRKDLIFNAEEDYLEAPEEAAGNKKEYDKSRKDFGKSGCDNSAGVSAKKDNWKEKSIPPSGKPAHNQHDSRNGQSGAPEIQQDHHAVQQHQKEIEYRKQKEKIYSFHENLNALVDEREATESDEPLTAEEVLDAAQEAGFEEAYAQQISDSYASSFKEDPDTPETFVDKKLLEKNAALKEVTDLKAEVSRLMKENLELKKRLEE